VVVGPCVVTTLGWHLVCEVKDTAVLVCHAFNFVVTGRATGPTIDTFGGWHTSLYFLPQPMNGSCVACC